MFGLIESQTAKMAVMPKSFPRRHILLVVIVIAAIGLTVWYFRKAPQIANFPSSGDAIIAFGDSLTAGEGVAASETYVAELSRRLGVQIVNAGVSGDTTAQALERLAPLLAEYPRPKLAIIMLGGNDFLQQRPMAETALNLSRIIEAFQAHGAVVVLVGVRGGIFSDAFAPEYERLSRVYKTAYVPNVLAGIIGDPRLRVDTIHPNAKGHLKMAERLEPVLRSLLK